MKMLRFELLQNNSKLIMFFKKIQYLGLLVFYFQVQFGKLFEGSDFVFFFSSDALHFVYC